MPVHACTRDGKPGYQWGGSGACYTYTEGDEAGRKEAKRKAIVQGYAAQQHGAKEGTMTDVHVPATRQSKSAQEALVALPDEVLLRPAVVSARTLTSLLALRVRGVAGLGMILPLKKAATAAGAGSWVGFTAKSLANSFGLYDLVLRKRPLNGHAPLVKASEDDLRILKADAKQLVTGVVFEPDVVDTQDDYVTAEEIETACHQFMGDYRAGRTILRLSHDHDLGDEDAVLVENWITPQAMTIGGNHVKQGAWLQTWHIRNGALWKAVEDGGLTGFSFGGTGERKEASADVKPKAVEVQVSRPAEFFAFDMVRDESGRIVGLRGTASRKIEIMRDAESGRVEETA